MMATMGIRIKKVPKTLNTVFQNLDVRLAEISKQIMPKIGGIIRLAIKR
jgi:hypothetical protein